MQDDMRINLRVAAEKLKRIEGDLAFISDCERGSINGKEIADKIDQNWRHLLNKIIGEMREEVKGEEEV
jgi:hypothetical protein